MSEKPKLTTHHSPLTTKQMPTINLKYGNSQIPFDYEENQFAILGDTAPKPALTDVEIGERFDNPIDSKTLEEIVKPNETFCSSCGRDAPNGERSKSSTCLSAADCQRHDAV